MTESVNSWKSKLKNKIVSRDMWTTELTVVEKKVKDVNGMDKVRGNKGKKY